MRGSPLLRALLILVFVAISGLGFSFLTGGRSGGMSAEPVAENDERPQGEGLEARYFLSLSAKASRVEMDAGGEALVLESGEGTEFSGTIPLDPANPVFGLKVEWADEAAGHRFAKLTLEIPQRETFRHVFDGRSDLDDFVELPVKP